MEKCTDHPDRMYAIVREWQDSGKPQKEFAAEQGINIHTFKYWIYKCRQQDGDEAGSFIRLDTLPGHQISLRYPNGIEVLVPARTPFAMLRQLINLQG